MHVVGNDDGKQACDSGKKNICFSGRVVSGFSSGSTSVDLQMVDGAFHNGPDPVKGVPFIRIPLNAGEHPEVRIFADICGTSF